MSDDLVQRGTQAMMQSEPWSSFWGKADAEKLARAAIALALEEAARVVEFSPDSHTAREVQLMLDKAAAIRALIPKEFA